jgi:hypothetical protein
LIDISLGEGSSDPSDGKSTLGFSDFTNCAIFTYIFKPFSVSKHAIEREIILLSEFKPVAIWTSLLSIVLKNFNTLIAEIQKTPST